MTLYEKVGRKYRPAHDTLAIDGLPNGSWLVTVQDGLTKVRSPVDDQRALELLAACTRWLSEWLSKELLEASKPREGRTKELTAREKRAFAAWRKIAGPTAQMWLTYDSAAGMANTVCKKLQEHIKKGLVFPNGSDNQ